MAYQKNKHLFLHVIAFVLVFLFSFAAIYGGAHILYREAYPKKYSDAVSEYTGLYQVDENLVYAVIRSESRFNPEAVSDIGACGLMQITEETFDWAKSRMSKDDGATYQDIFNPQVNIKYGTYILHLLLDEFSDKKTAIAAYHAGWGNVKQWLNNPEHSEDGFQIDNIPFEDTNAYVNQVFESQEIYQTLYQNKWIKEK